MDDERWSLSDAQEAVDDWIGQFEEGYWDSLSNLARLTEEVGELARLINELDGDKPADTQPETDRLADEIGDLLFVIISLANTYDIDLEDALRAALHKYQVRDVDRFTPRDD